jgi:hypothetical protein
LRWGGDGETAHDVDVGDVKVYVLTWEMSERWLLDVSKRKLEGILQLKPML